MKFFNYHKGKTGEEIARNFLTKKGCQIIKSNFQSRFGEIDLIAVLNKTLIFVEVKLKTGEQFGSPEEMINPRKLRQIQNMAAVFIQQNPQLANDYPSYRIDAVCIVLNDDGSVLRINHYENIGNEMV